MSATEVVILGTGAGRSAVYAGLPSSSFILEQDGLPLCLVDAGLGVGQQVLSLYGAFPRTLIVTHNHSDHAGELPVILRVEQAEGRRMRVFAQSRVSRMLREHRVAEHLEQVDAESLADWVAPDSFEAVPLVGDLSVIFYPGKHTLFSCGFIIFRGDVPILGYTGDSEFDESLYRQLQQAGVVLMDAGPESRPGHASFNEIKPWLGPGRYIMGHGLDARQAREWKAQGWPVLWQGERIALPEFPSGRQE